MKEKYSFTQKILQSEGLRYTKQREAIWIEINGNLKSIEMLMKSIFLFLKKKTKVSRATVYRTIDVLVKHGLVKKIDGVESGSLYENKLDREHHDHMICLETGKIIEFYNKELENLQDKIAREKDIKLLGMSINFCKAN